MSAAEAAEPPAEVVDDAETEDEPTIPLASLSEATIKRGHHLHNTPSSFITPAAPLQAPVPPHTPHSGGAGPQSTWQLPSGAAAAAAPAAAPPRLPGSTAPRDGFGLPFSRSLFLQREEEGHMLASLALSVVPIHDEHTTVAPDVPPVNARPLVPQQEAQPPTLWDVPFFDEEEAYYKAALDLDLEHPVLDHLVSLDTHLNIFMWGDSTIAHQFFLLRALTGGEESETEPLYNVSVPWPAQNTTVCPEVNVHEHHTIYGKASIHLTAAVCKTGLVSVAMAPAVLEELHEEHGLNLPRNHGLTLLYIGGSGLHHLHLEDGLEHEHDQDWQSKKPLEESFEENLKYGLATLQKRYPGAGLAYLQTIAICNSKLWELHSARATACDSCAVACDSGDMKKCFSDVDVPSSERDWYRGTLFSHYGSGVIANREQAVLDDPSLEWTLVHGRKISKEASCNQTEDGMHYLEPTMMKMIEEALAVLGEGSAVASTRADKADEGHHSQTEEGHRHHPLKRMQKRVLAHAHKGKLERAHEKMRQVERARESAGRRGEEEKKRKKKVRAMEKMKRVRARKDEAARTPSAQEAQVRPYRHALTLSLSLSLSLSLTRCTSTGTHWRRARRTRTTTARPPTGRATTCTCCTSLRPR